MQLLETYSQDIKSERNYKPCAPDFFRWVVISGYLTIVISAVICGIVAYNEHRMHLASKQSEQKLSEMNAKIEQARGQGSQSNEAKTKYNELQNWLQGNYSLAHFFIDTFKILPAEARLQEMILNPISGQPGAFNIKMRFFGQSSGTSINLDQFEEKWVSSGIELSDRQQSVAEGGKSELGGNITLPAKYYPGGVVPNGAPRGLINPAMNNGEEAQ